MSNTVFGKIIENSRKNRDLKLVTTETSRNHLVSEPNYYTTKFFTENMLAIEMKKPKYLRINQSTYDFQYYNLIKYQCMSFGMIM